jgi:hypothetical protein
MKYYFDALKRPGNIAWINEITLDEFNALGKRRETVAIAGAKIVQHTHAVAPLQQRTRDV